MTKTCNKIIEQLKLKQKQKYKNGKIKANRFRIVKAVLAASSTAIHKPFFHY